jgi:hypothetical protein
MGADISNRQGLTMHSRFLAATALGLILSTPALALTPEEAWESWQAMSTAAGQSITATGTARNGDTLVVSGITMGMTIPDGPVVASTIPEVKFRDRGDGSVEITYPVSYDVKLSEPGAPSAATITVVQDQMVLIASGEATSPSFDFTAKGVVLTIKDVINPQGQPTDMSGTLSMADLAGKYVALPSSGGQAYDSAFSASGMVLQVAAKEPAQQVDLTFDMSIAQPSFTGKTVTVAPELMQSGNMSAALAAGFMVEGEYSTGPISTKLNMTENGTPGAFDATFTGTKAHITMNADRFDYGFGMMGAAINASGFEIPMPMVTGAFGEMAFGFAMPVKASEEPQDFTALVKVVDLTMADDLWSMFDPGGALKRDPVTLIADLAGTGAWTVDILDPATQIDQGPDLPAKLFSLNLTQVLLKAAGAQVAATGALTFDNADLMSYAGFPAPEGKVTITMDGINALLDALVAIGVVSADDLMGARMGLAMMAKPGAGPDQLISEIEFRAGGSLFVNGVQMQ